MVIFVSTIFGGMTIYGVLVAITKGNDSVIGRSIVLFVNVLWLNLFNDNFIFWFMLVIQLSIGTALVSLPILIAFKNRDALIITAYTFLLSSVFLDIMRFGSSFEYALLVLCKYAAYSLLALLVYHSFFGRFSKPPTS